MDCVSLGKKLKKIKLSIFSHNVKDYLIPVYIFTGFLGSGKTSIINSLLERHLRKDNNICVIKFENGEKELLTNKNIKILNVSIRDVQQEDGVRTVSSFIYDFLISNEIDEIFIEWNGMLGTDILFNIMCGTKTEDVCIPSDL